MKAVLALVVSSLATGAQAWGWLNTPLEAPEATLTSQNHVNGAEDGLCIAAILAAEARYQIPDNLLLALGIQEAGFQGPRGLTIWPWSVNAAGEGRRFDSRAEAENFVRAKQLSGVESIDVGCLQINLRWHPHAFQTLSLGFDPTRNIDYAARFLRGLYEESGSWRLAAGRYHSHSPEPQAKYLASLERNHAVVQRRFEELVALAQGVAFTERLPLRPPVQYRTEGAIWGGDIAGSDGARRSLYSAKDIEPILPHFLASES